MSCRPVLAKRFARARPATDPLERARMRAALRARMLGESAEPLTVGRYVILGEIGAGAMGVVYAAHDPELDRRVALKLLAAGLRNCDDRRTALLREAKALASLVHPNVVEVLDVGTTDDHVWIVMELVEGRTLDRWLAERARSWPDIVKVVIDAALGLAAAHRANLIHRDFKPNNVMVAHDGRVRVLDFGLADALREGASTHRAAAGTPGYMAPELLNGGEASAASDQYALCITLHEALFGKRHDRGHRSTEATPHQATESSSSPSVAPVHVRNTTAQPAVPRVPEWLRSVVLRGLHRDPAARWPDIDALVGILARGRLRARRRWTGALVAGVSAVLLGALAWSRLMVSQQVSRCEAMGTHQRAQLDSYDRQRVRRGLLATNVGYANSTNQRVLAMLGDYTETWASTATHACLSATVDHSLDLRRYERVQWCLEGHRTEMSSLIDQLAEADSATVQRAIGFLAQLPPIEHCTQADHLARVRLPAPQLRRDIRHLTASISRAKRLAAVGHADDALVELQALAVMALEMDAPALARDLRLSEALIRDGLGEYAQARAIAGDVYFEAAAAGDWDTASGAAITIVAAIGGSGDALAEGLSWSRHAEVALRNAGDSHGLRESWRQDSLISLHRAGGDLQSARDAGEQSLAIREALLGISNPAVAATMSNLALIHSDLGEYDAALRLGQRALEIRQQALGPDHPDVATSLTGLAIATRHLGDTAGALVLHRRAAAIRRVALGPRHPHVAETLVNIAVSLGSSEYEEQRELYSEALAIYEEAPGPHHPNIAIVLDNLAINYAIRADFKRARGLSQRSLAVHEAIGRGPHRDHARALANHAETLAHLGELRNATETYEQARSMREAVFGADHQSVTSMAPTNEWLARLLSQQSQP